MYQTPSQRRMAENEVVFRKYNERVQHGFDEVRRLAEDSGQNHLIVEDDTPLHFYCECSDENCRKRIQVAPSHFAEIHKRRDRFIIIRGHETASIEKVVEEHPEFCVVEKFVPPPEDVDKLNKTDVDNS